MGRLDPGYSTWRGQMLYELTKAKTMAARRDAKSGAKTKKDLETAVAEERFMAMYLAYHQSIFFGKNFSAD